MHGRLPGPIWLPAATAVGLAVAAPAVATAAVSVAVATAVGFAVAAPAVTAAAVTTAAVAAAAVITAAIVAAAVSVAVAAAAGGLRSHDVAGIQGAYLFYEVWRRVHCCCVPSRQWRELRKLLCTPRPIVRRFVGRQEQ